MGAIILIILAKNAPPGDPWELLERTLTLIAVFVAVVSLLIANRSLAHNREEAERVRRSQVTELLSLSDLIRSRMEAIWMRSVKSAYAVDQSSLKWFLSEIGQDLLFSGQLQGAASRVDLKTVTSAEVVWNTCNQIQTELKFYERRLQSLVAGDSGAYWRPHRVTVVERAFTALCALDDIEGRFGSHLTDVDGVSRGYYFHSTLAAFEDRAIEEARAYLESLDPSDLPD